jgi:hypothetical protein
VTFSFPTYREAACVFCGDDGKPLTDEHLWSDWMTSSLKSLHTNTRDSDDAPFAIVRRTEGRSHRVDDQEFY